MTWITATLKEKSHTHYYLGLSSLCKEKSIDSESSYTVRIKYVASYCATCKNMLKSKKIHHTTQQRYKKLSHAQKQEKTGNRPRLEKQLLNIIHPSNTTLPAKISQIKETIHQFYPEINIEDIILPLVTSRKVTVSGDLISPCFVETSHVK